MQISGKIKVFREEHNGSNGTWYSYSTSVGNKRDDGKWDNDYYEVVLAKGARDAVIENGAVIDIVDGFLSCRSYVDKGGARKVISQIVIMDFTTGEGAETGFAAMRDDDLPF